MSIFQKNNVSGAEQCYFSIIIPVYNAAKYLVECIDSILKQSYRNFEILLIDDGSTDGSAKICDEYTQKDGRIKCWHLPNGGPSKARNTGFRNANGKYVYCIDDDDKILSETYFSEVFALLAEKEVDVVLTGATYFMASTAEIKKAVDYSRFDDINHLSCRDMITKLIRTHEMQISCWTKFIRRDFLEKYSLYFDENLIVEDMEWCLRMWPVSESMAVLQRADYCHIYREGSIASGDSPRTIKCREDQITTIRKGLEILENDKSDPAFVAVLLTYMNFQFFIAMHSIVLLHGENKRRLLKELLQYDRITKYTLDKRVKILSVLYHLGGVPGALFGMKLYTWLLRPSTRKRFFHQNTSTILQDTPKNA